MSNNMMDSRDREVYENNLKRREDLLDVLFKGGTPENNKDMRLAKELMESSDTAIMAKTGLKLKSKALESNDQIQATIVELVRQNAINRSKGTRESDSEVILDADVLPDFEPVPGQLDMGHRKLELDDVIKNGEKNEEL